MTKTAGMGDNFYVGGYDLSGLTAALSNIHGGPSNTQNSTDITQSANARLGLERDGGMGWTSFWDPTGAAHVLLSALPVTDNIAMYCRGTTLGNPAACCNSKLIGYDPTRGQDGSLTLAVQAQANGFGLEWGVQLTAGKRTDTAATNGSSIDDAAATAFGAQAYLQVFSFAGTDATVKIQDSADNSSFADVSGLTFTQVTSNTPASPRRAITNTSTLRRYVRAVTVTTGGFTSLVFAVAYTRNTLAGVVF
jgi:hypothetical protein